jgi:hypothetical protein
MFYIEPSADLRKFAQLIRQAYVALLEQGFSDDESMMIVLAMVSKPNVKDSDGF